MYYILSWLLILWFGRTKLLFAVAAAFGDGGPFITYYIIYYGLRGPVAVAVGVLLYYLNAFVGLGFTSLVN